MKPTKFTYYTLAGVLTFAPLIEASKPAELWPNYHVHEEIAACEGRSTATIVCSGSYSASREPEPYYYAPPLSAWWSGG